MSYSKFGEMIKKQRNLKDATIYDVGKLADVTNTYISQIENGKKLPSKKVIFLIAHFLGIHSGENNNFREEIIREYAKLKDIDETELMNEFQTYIKDYLDEKMKPMKKMAEDWDNNRIQAKKNTLETQRIEKPYFDLKWLLNQKEYEVLYGREYDIQGTQWVGKDIMDKMLFNRLNDEDIKIIREMIEAYISNRYKKIYKKKGD